MLHKTPVGETFFEELKRYTRFGPDDEQALRALLPYVEPNLTAISDQFYARLSEHAAAAAVLENDAQTERLKGTLRAWTTKLLSGPWDEGYYEQRSRIGRVHVTVSLPQRYMFMAMSVLHGQLIDATWNAFETAPERRVRTIEALQKIVDIELAIMLETYRDDYVDRVQRYDRREKVELEQRLAASEARYLGIVENAGALVLVVDDDHDIVLFNRTAETVTGWPRGAMLGSNCSAMCNAEDLDRARTSIQAALDGDHPAPFETRVTTSDGRIRWVRWHASPLLGDEIQTACLIGIDTTEERNLTRRTQRAEQLASLGTLAAGLAHEIRNPLNAAQLQLTLVNRRIAKGGDDDRERAAKAANAVQIELQRLAGLVQDFLAFARPTELRLQTGDLHKTARTVVTLTEPYANEHQVSLTLQDSEAVTAQYDEERIKQVMLNLVRNALEAAGKGGEVTVGVTRNADRAVITVSDTGPGLPDGMNVFEPFATSKEGGTGLGLPISHRIVTDHGGDIDIRRRAGRTIFAVSLPIDAT